ncbi:MAG: PDZ domain-containing protein [Acidobacteriaceae bacterium]|jgi:carboxyl-terminal processing protease|nr:PDZ domain-containing protein [Acidobacteriaceae bacterium]
MSTHTRRLVLWISLPVVAFAVVGGFLSQATARDDAYPSLRMFENVVSLITGNYVEPVNIDKVMNGAMHGLADSLDPDSAYLTPDLVKQIEANAPLPAGDVGLDLTRQYYLRVIATRDGSPAERAGIRTGDYIRIIGDTPTREMSVFEGMRRLRGVPGSTVTVTVIRGSTTDPHVIELMREAIPTTDVTGKILQPGVGYLRIAAVSPRTAEQTKARVAELTRAGASKLIVDVRRTSGGTLDGGIALAKLFVKNGTITSKESKDNHHQVVSSDAKDGSITLPTTLLVNIGTSGGAELFAAALLGNKRADAIGEHTIGRAAEQHLVKLPDGSGLWLTTSRYLTPDGSPLHEKGIEPTVSVDEPEVEFGQQPPTGDPILEKALEQI